MARTSIGESHAPKARFHVVASAIVGLLLVASCTSSTPRGTGGTPTPSSSKSAARSISLHVVKVLSASRERLTFSAFRVAPSARVALIDAQCVPSCPTPVDAIEVVSIDSGKKLAERTLDLGCAKQQAVPAIALGQQDQQLLLGSCNSNDLLVLDVHTLAIIRRVALPIQVRDIATEANGDRIWITGGRKRLMLAGSDDRVSKTVSLPYLAGDVAVSAEPPRVYVSADEEATISVIDSEKARLLRSFQGPGAGGCLAAESARGSLLVKSSGSTQFFMTRDDGNSVHHFPVMSLFCAFAFDESLNVVVTPDTPGIIRVLDADRFEQITELPIAPSDISFIQIDQVHDEVFAEAAGSIFAISLV